ncbi:hypothetical protein [Ruegeria arenilitoris]|uniref:hypothetical protein n=1 Tax=Ruegeria arenilitoris TaxID=1173585 RepID=UPI00147B00CA|nr:hypothetical protein [Ruegeria arenilitoris]
MDRVELRAIAVAIKEEAQTRKDLRGLNQFSWYPLERDVEWSKYGYPESSAGVEISQQVQYPVTLKQARELPVDEIERLIAEEYKKALQKMAATIEESRKEEFGSRIVH